MYDREAVSTTTYGVDSTPFEDAFPYFFPGRARLGIFLVLDETSFELGYLCFIQRNGFGAFGNAVPYRLHEFNSLRDRKCAGFVEKAGFHMGTIGACREV